MNIPYKGQPLFGVQKRNYIYQHVESEVLILTVEVFNKSKPANLLIILTAHFLPIDHLTEKCHS